MQVEASNPYRFGKFIMTKLEGKAMEDIKPIRILHVVGAMNRGGTETMLMNIYRKIDHGHVQFDFISYDQEEAHYDQEIKQLGGRIIRLTKTSSIKQIYQTIKVYGPFAAIHAHTLFHCGLTGIAARLAGVNIRISHAHTTSDHSQSIVRKVYMKMMRSIIRKSSTHLLACSKGAGLYLFGSSCLTKPTYAYFPNVIDYKKFLTVSQTEVKKFKVEAGLGNHLVLGHIGTFKVVKNHSFLLEIMKRIQKESSAKMVLVGDGELREKIQQEAEKAGLGEKICFVGVREDVTTILNSMDVFIFPSLAEGLGLVLLEAQASGIPCLVSEAIQPEADLKIDLVTKLKIADGPQAWADKIIELATKKEQDTNKITASFEKNGYAIKSGISKLMAIYQVCRREENEAGTNCIL